jgi:hypothetical protein
VMKHYYQNIGEDWFSYPRLYAHAVNHFDSGEFVEVGSWRGRSSVYMGVEIINSAKDLFLYCVDTWEGSIENQGHPLLDGDGLWKEFLQNIDPVSGMVEPMRMTSLMAAEYFKSIDKKFEFVFIDASHDYENVKADIEAWMPLVRDGGVLAGHDYPTWPGVKKAVDEIFPRRSIVAKWDCWVWQNGDNSFLKRL